MSQDKSENMEHGWPKKERFRKSIQLEIVLYMSVVFILVMLTTGYIITNQYSETVGQNVLEKLLVQARSYSGPAGKLLISSEKPDELLLNNICRKLADDNQDIYWSGITDQNLRFLAHTDLQKVIAGDKLPDTYSGEDNPLIRKGERYAKVNDTLLISIPIIENGILLGRLGAAASTAQIAAARKRSATTVAGITIIMILIGLPITAFVMNAKLKPIRTITTGLHDISFEDFSVEIPYSSRNEFGYLAETLRIMGHKLGLAQKEMVERERMAREYEIAREIQERILPKAFPQGSAFECAGTYRSAKEIGGDYYDFIQVDDRYLNILVADVSGKSLPGMLVMLMTRDIVKRVVLTTTEPAEILTAVNRELHPDIKQGMFVTMFFARLDVTTGALTYASAGHNPLIVIKGADGSLEQIKTKGFPLGLMPDSAFSKRIETGSLTLATGDWLVLYTDGINEAQNADGDEFGMERFTHILKENYRLCSKDLIDRVISGHEKFVGTAPQFDDITLLGMKWTGITADNTQTSDENGVHYADQHSNSI